jgi:hypothetical protein
MRGGTPAPPGLVRALERILLDCPWADAEIPCLVCADRQGKVVGFLGVHVRRMRFDGAPVRLACSGHLVTDPASRATAPGVFLLRRFLAGPQDLSITDGATAEVRRMWETLGGDTYHLAGVRWTRLLRPFRFAAKLLARRGWAALARVWLPLAGLPDRLARQVGPFRFRSPDPWVEPVPLTPELFTGHLPALARGCRLYPDYDRDFAAWLFAELARVTSRGELHAWAVPGERSRPLGWFIYYLAPRDTATVVQVAAAPGAEDTVLGHLFAHAWRRGAAAVQGRVEPNLLPDLARHRSILRYPDALPLVHARRPELLQATHSGRAFLTRLEGEWWMAFHLDRYD